MSTRASLLSGLRTGGVRSASNPSSNIPRTAAPGASFNLPQIDQPNDQVSDSSMPGASFNRQMPMTAAVDGLNNKFQQQQAATFNPGFNLQVPSAHVQLQAQALQMQMMQLEILRLQSLQVQQQNVELIAQAQRQQTQNKRSTFNPPASAGPLSNGFDLRSATLRRANQAEMLKSQTTSSDGQVPMTAAIGGKFGNRTPLDDSPPPLPSTTVISGGASLGSSNSSGTHHYTPSKSDTAVSWRRGGNTKPTTPRTPLVKVEITPPEPTSPPPSASAAKSRPVPLHLAPAISKPLPAVAVDNTDSQDENAGTTSSSESSKSSEESVSPTTSQSDLSSNESPLSPREEASKKLYAGLGLGRPSSASALTEGSTTSCSSNSHRLACHPLRQPRGPPSGADELGPKNFATRIRRKAIGGLGALIGARERRDFVEAF